MLINKRRGKQAVLLATTSVFAFTAVFSGVGSALAQVVPSVAAVTVRTTSNVAAADTVSGTEVAPVSMELIGGGTIQNRGRIQGLTDDIAILVADEASAATQIDNYGTIETANTRANKF
jgi:hypothetical protein